MKGYVILIASVAALGGLLFGFDTAVIAGTTSYITKYFSLTNWQLGLAVAATSLGCIGGAFVSGRLADRFGRKKIMLLTAILYMVAAIGSGLAGTFATLVIYRIVGGVAIGLASAIAPIYISEIAPAGERGRLGMLQQLAIVIGILLSSLSNYLIARVEIDDPWRYMLGIAFLPSLAFFLLLLLVPESPRWLILKGKTAQGERIFARISPDAKALVEAVLAETASHVIAPFREIFTHRYRRVVFIGFCFASLAQLTGINIIFYYAPLIFQTTHMGGSALFQTLLLGIDNLVFTVVAFWMIDRLGRKKLLLAGSVIMTLCLAFLGILFWKQATNNVYVLAGMFLYIAGFACSWGVVLWVYVAEIFPNRIRGSATSMAVTGNWTANTLVVLTFPQILATLKGGPTFLVYAALNAGMIWFVWKYVFETKGIPLEKIEGAYT